MHTLQTVSTEEHQPEACGLVLFLVFYHKRFEIRYNKSNLHMVKNQGVRMGGAPMELSFRLASVEDAPLIHEVTQSAFSEYRVTEEYWVERPAGNIRTVYMSKDLSA
ncbi:hypothetical protein EL26_05775 [Tumebacillus flagellatus]|uniref:Uncharacterized protein n=2 Tax=Tumebacillus flagellatus TaxID=1157490 RepID=A0A074LTB7_9BACL|nr:hypothetical protein EL26_05775 [Tumebacillus flagellatus]